MDLLTCLKPLLAENMRLVWTLPYPQLNGPHAQFTGEREACGLQEPLLPSGALRQRATSQLEPACSSLRNNETNADTFGTCSMAFDLFC